jgi:predicted Zn-dependent protease
MYQCLRAIWFLILLSFPVQAALAERSPEKQAVSDLASAADQLFAEFFGDTESERQLLDDVEVSPEEERQIGESSLESLFLSLKEQKIRILNRGKDLDYLKSLVSTIHPLMRNAKRYPAIRVYAVESTVTDARAFPGGSIVCSTAMIDFARSEAALVGVLAHELSHIDRGHQLRIARSVKLAEGTWDRGSASGPATMRTGILLAKQFARPFRSEDEVEADFDAAKWMFELGYAPLEMAVLFRRLNERYPADSLRMPSFLRTHPYHGERYETLKQLALRLKTQRPDAKLYIGRTNLQKRIPRSIKEFPK